MAMACLLGHRFTTLTMLQQFIPYQQDLVRYYGFEAKCASVRAINVNVEEHLEILSRDPWNQGWLIKLQPRSKALDGPELMDAAAYEAFITASKH